MAAPWRELGAGLGAGGAAVLLALPTLVAPPDAYDGGIAASNATFILNGALPYRDFWLLYGPLSGYVTAAATAIAGPSIELLRVLGMSVLLLQGLAGYLLARSFARPAPAAIAATAAAVVMFAWAGPELGAWNLAMALATSGLAATLRGNGPPAMLAGGVLVGLAFTARLDVGAYAAAALLVGLRSRSVPAIAGAAAVAVPVSLLVVASVPVGELYEQLVWYPTVGQREFRSMPGPWPVPVGDLTLIEGLASVLLSYLPAGLLVAAGVRLWRGGWEPAAVLTVVVFGALAELQASVRADLPHAAQAATPALLVGAWLADSLRSRLWRVVATGAVVAPAALAVLVGVTRASELPTHEHELVAATEYVRDRTAAGEPILVGETSHRYTFANPLLGYYLADRPAGVRVAQYNPGVTNTAEIQAQMIEELDRAAVRYLILDRLFADYCEPWNRSCEPGSDVLDQYIADEYQVDRDFGNLVVMVRR